MKKWEENFGMKGQLLVCDKLKNENWLKEVKNSENQNGVRRMIKNMEFENVSAAINK